MSDTPGPTTSSAPALAGMGDVKTTDYMDDVEYHRVADFLDVGYEDRKDVRVAQKLSYLYDWAKETTKSDDRIKRLEAVKDLQKRLGLPQTGPETIKKLYQYARLDQQRRKLEGEMELMSLTPTPQVVK